MHDDRYLPPVAVSCRIAGRQRHGNPVAFYLPCILPGQRIGTFRIDYLEMVRFNRIPLRLPGVVSGYIELRMQ